MRTTGLSRIAVGVLIAAAATSSFAQRDYKGEHMVRVAPPCQSLMCGFYVGAQAGYDAFRVRHTLTGDSGSFSNTASVTGWLGGLFIGYGQYFNSMFYLGGELLGNYSGADQTFASGSDDDGDSFSRRTRIRGTWGLALIPGLRLNEATLGYLRLGYDWTNAKHTTTFVNNGGPTTSFSNSHTYGGFDFGLGLETVIMANWSVRTQYDHIWYQNKSTSPAPGVTATTNPSDNQFTLGLVYHIA